MRPYVTKQHHSVYLFGLFTLLGVGIPFCLATVTLVSFMDLFIPLTGRAGSIVPIEFTMGGLCAIFGSLLLLYVVMTH